MFFNEVVGKKNKYKNRKAIWFEYIITATRLGVTKQVIKTEDELTALYPKLGLPKNLVEDDYRKNQKTLNKCFKLGQKLSK